jgi:uncharacterized protein
MIIVDAHQHLGTSMYSHTTTTPQALMTALDTHGIQTALVMPQPSTEHPAAVHDLIAETAAQHPGRIYGIANVSPRLVASDYRAEVWRCLSELDFRAIKLHPLGHNVSVASPDARIVFETAAAYNVPVLIHTGTGNPQSLPSLALRPALAFPELPIILCHAGWSVYSEEAIVAAEVAENLYLEPSWCGPYQIRAMVDAVGAARVLYGSDHLNNIPAELAKLQHIDLSEGELRQILAENARRLFKLP